MCPRSKVEMFARPVECSKCDWKGKISECRARESRVIPGLLDLICPLCRERVVDANLEMSIVAVPEHTG